ncbi:hypothetical protein ABZU75_42630 [Streptosporangium sp. NPDC005286]|uniref:hypothetical protein n=1 Tax=Streptosporangium sp. NPDC005286 TaxID=3154463 RepID=UPI0033B9B489
MLRHRFGTDGRGVQPWQVVRQDHPGLYPPGLPAAKRFPIHVYLADSRTGRVLAVQVNGARSRASRPLSG